MASNLAASSTGMRVPSGETALRRSLGQTLLGVFVLGMSLLWLTMFTISLWTFPRAIGASKAREVDVIASYLPEGKSRLGLTTPDGQLHRHLCDPLTRFCRFVKEHPSVPVKVRVAGPTSGLSDSAILFARAGDTVLVSDAEGQENLASLKRTYLGGLSASIVGLILGIMLLHPRMALVADA